MESKNILEGAKLTRQVLTELVDAVVNSDRAADCSAELTDLQKRMEESIRRERDINNKIAEVLDTYQKEEGMDQFTMYRDSILDHTRASLQGYEEKLIPALKADIDSKTQEMNSYRAKSTKAIEAFLSREPLPLLEWEIRLKYVEGGYEARYICTSQHDLLYEFLLNSSEVEFLKSKMEVDTLVKGIKLPARIGKTWVSKDPVIDFEKFDHYFLSSAVLSPTNLVLTFANDETDSAYTFHSSVSEDSHFLEIEYRDQMQTVNITSQPAMNSAVNRGVLISLISQIRVAMLYLREHKLRLSRLVLREIDIMATMKVTDLFYTILEILSPLITQEVTAALSSSQEVDEPEQGGITRNFIYQRLSLLGDRSNTVASLMGIPGFMDTMSKSQ